MEASYYVKLDENSVKCELCPNNCIIAKNKTGSCRVRTNKNGVLNADSYGEVVSLALDPIEKKPLYHFHPSSLILSTGPNGCNFKCGFCQNYEISQKKNYTKKVTPENLAELAKMKNSIGVAYTYSEPFIWFEFVRDSARLVKENGLLNVLVTNGYVNEKPLKELLPLIDAMNIDVKSMSPEFYKKVCRGNLADVLKTVETSLKHCHVEITNLVIPGYNDTDEDFKNLVNWIESLNPAIPLHFSRYFPQYKFSEPPTPVSTLKKAYEIAKEKLKNVYVGNISIDGTSDTVCSFCKKVIVKRTSYYSEIVGIKNGMCVYCDTSANFVGV